MTDSTLAPETRSRRALLGAAAGAAAAVAATAMAPAAALAADPNDVVLNQDNASTALTSITQGTADTAAFKAKGKGNGEGVVGTTDATLLAGVVGYAGDPADSIYVQQSFDLNAGVYGYAAQNDASSGVMAEGPTALYAFGDWGVWADGYGVGVFASAYNNGTGVHAHTGTVPAPAAVSNVALRGTVSNAASQVGLQAYGRVQFPNRSGRVTFATGAASKAITVNGVSASNIAIAVLNANKTGVYVRAVVPATNKITIYLSKAAPSGTIVAWMVLG